MKKLILALGITLWGACSVLGQDNSVEKQTTKMLATLTAVCKLTPDQVTKVKPMIESYEKARAANKQKYTNDPDGLKVANKESRKNFKTQLKTVLTVDQMDKYKEYRKDEREKKQQAKESNEE